MKQLMGNSNFAYSVFWLLALCALILGFTGCGRQLVLNEMESVAKDWSMTIRASQVIPVYPLTEDLQPGDVFLVETPIQEQAKEYMEKGFLRLDQLFTRLDELNYREFYQDAYWQGSYPAVPHKRPQREVPDDTNGAPADRKFADINAARAAFPTYAFKVNSGAGLKLAVPVQGVPLGLNMMQTDQATGSITIADAFTYASTIEELYIKLLEWSSEPLVRAELARIVKQANDQAVFLRVVNRVYLTGAVVVSLQNDKMAGVQATAGTDQGLNLLTVKDQNSVENYKNITSALKSAVAMALPGGEIQFAHATQRSVTMSEAFERPLVIGYLGFDVQILPSGDIGPPMATSATLQGHLELLLTQEVGTLTEAQRAVKFRLLELEAMSEKQSAKVIKIVLAVCNALDKKHFIKTIEKASQAPYEVKSVMERFTIDMTSYVAKDGAAGLRYRRAVSLLDHGLLGR